MGKAHARLIFPLVLAAVAGGAGLGLVACFDDFSVLKEGPDSSSPQVDSAVAVDGAGPPADGSVDAPVDGDAGMKTTHCDSVVPPVGVTAVDFLCADFDSPLLGKGWDDIFRNDGGVLEKTNEVAHSAPTAMVTTASGVNGEGTLSWKRTGASRFTEATAVFHINPTILGGVILPATGTLDLVHITTSNASATFGYSRGSTDFGGAAYIGYYVNVAAFGGAAAIQRFKITAVPLDPNVWTEVKLSWEAATGKVTVLYNNNNVFTQTGFSSLDTAVTFRIGANASGDVGVMPRHRFDDVTLSIRR